MEGNGQNSSSEHLTQKDIVQLLLHNAQHMVTREELKSDINEVKDENFTLTPLYYGLFQQP
jgi:hypothetical protein